jgi:hypothetical protein
MKYTVARFIKITKESGHPNIGYRFPASGVLSASA